MNRDELKMLQALPLDIKVAKSKQRIREFIDKLGIDNVYISFSGGKDSTVLACLIREVEQEYPEHEPIPLVFADTGLEYPEIRQFVLKQKDVVIIKPKMNFQQVIKKYGYPVVDKNTSANLYKLRKCNLSDKFRNYLLNGDERGNYGTVPKKWQPLINSDFNINSTCCDVMKKRPFHKYEKDSGRFPITGEMASESRLRTKQYLLYGCNAFEERKKGPKSIPLGFWTENDVLEYIYENNIEIAAPYGNVIVYKTVNDKKYFTTTKVKRTGCIFCMYGCHLEKEPNRFQQLKVTHPQIYDFCMRGGKYDEDGLWIPDKGLGLDHVLTELGVKH